MLHKIRTAEVAENSHEGHMIMTFQYDIHIITSKILLYGLLYIVWLAEGCFYGLEADMRLHDRLWHS